MADATPNSPATPQPRRWTIFAAALLLVALTLVVIYTSRGAFSSPLAIVVAAAIGLAALLLQLRLRPDGAKQVRAPIGLNVFGLICALAAVFADLLRLGPGLMLLAALGAVVCFGGSGIFVLRALRRQK